MAVSRIFLALTLFVSFTVSDAAAFDPDSWCTLTLGGFCSNSIICVETTDIRHEGERCSDGSKCCMQ